MVGIMETNTNYVMYDFWKNDDIETETVSENDLRSGDLVQMGDWVNMCLFVHFKDGDVTIGWLSPVNKNFTIIHRPASACYHWDRIVLSSSK